MSETEISGAWSALEPSARRRARIETRVFEWLEASETSLFREWFSLLKIEPLTVLACVSVGGVGLMMLTPVGWMMTFLLN